MSMLGRVAAVPSEMAERLGREPALICDLLDFDPDAMRKARQGMIGRLLSALRPTPVRKPQLGPLAAADCFDLDHHWHILHYLFTGTAWDGAVPEGFIAVAGAPVGEIDVGYGPARLFAPDEVRRIAALLGSVTRAGLRRRYVPPDIVAAEIYGGGAFEAEEADRHVDDLFGIAQDLRDFVGRVAARGDGMLAYIY